MRELSPWARKSQGRDRHRAFYARYIVSAAWFRRRDEWAVAEAARVAPSPVLCRGGCGTVWNVTRDDLHHLDYSRLGNEAHEDLWAMCRSCHNALHRLIESTKSWRRLPKRQANMQGIAVLAARTGTKPTPVNEQTVGREK